MTIVAVRLPKWGLSMQEGTVAGWSKAEGETVAEGEDLLEIETDKIANVAESPASGVLRRIVAGVGETLPVGALLGVIAGPEVADDEVETFVEAARAAPPETEAATGDALRLDLTPEDGAGPQLRYGAVRWEAGGGEGAPTVLLHGFASDLQSWMLNLEAVAALGPVLAFDLPGHGGSEKEVGDGSAATLAQAVLAALDALGVGGFRLVGHSLGAAVALELAALAGDRVRAVALISPAYLSGGPPARAFLDGVVEAGRYRPLRAALETIADDPAALSREMVEEVLRAKRLDGVEEAFAALRDRMLDGADAASARRALSGVPRGAVLASEGDRVVGAPDRAILPPGWTLTVLSGASHIPHLERAPEVNAWLAEALKP